jgi:hypothetical protein
MEDPSLVMLDQILHGLEYAYKVAAPLDSSYALKLARARESIREAKRDVLKVLTHFEKEQGCPRKMELVSTPQ